MIEANHLQAARSGGAQRCDVILRIDQESMRILSEISRPSRFEYLVAASDQQAAAFSRIRFAGMSCHCVGDAVGE
jgi:hypothetical protein